jgi:hypothetical protein
MHSNIPHRDDALGKPPLRAGRCDTTGFARAAGAMGAGRGAWTAVPAPGPLHAFSERTKTRRGHGKAIVATARTLAILFWCLLTHREAYAHQQPSLTSKPEDQPESGRERDTGARIDSGPRRAKPRGRPGS